MYEVTLGDEDMILLTIVPNGPVQGVPTWSVISGNGTLLGDPTDWDPAMAYPEAHDAWNHGGLEEGFQMFVVSETLPDGEAGPLMTTYEVSADVDLGEGASMLREPLTLLTINKASTLGITASAPIKKPPTTP